MHPGCHKQAATLSLQALYALLASILIGLTGGFILHLLTRSMDKMNEVLLVSLSMLFFVIALSMMLRLSPLIANMVMGATIINLSLRNNRIFSLLEPLTPPLFALFFILAGVELDISVFTKGLIGVYGIIYLVSRFSGKYVGAYFSALLVRAPQKIRKYLGFCLFPQEGVAIGLALYMQTSRVLAQSAPEVKQMLSTVINIVLFSVVVNEFIGPVISRFGIIRGMDIERR